MAEDDQARSMSRIKAFKNVNKGKDEWKSRRNTSSSELRQSKREDQIAKRRQAGVVNEAANPNVKAALEDMHKYIAMMKSDDIAVVQEGVTSIRLLMCVKKDPPIKQAVAANVQHDLVGLLGLFAHPDLQFEAAWALTNIGSGDSDDTRTIIEAGAIGPLVKLLSSPVSKVRVQGMWALGNISGDDEYCRDLVLQEGGLPPIVTLLWGSVRDPSAEKDLELISTGTWTLSNFVRGKKKSPEFYSMVEGVVELLAHILGSTDDHSTLADACWALSYLSDADEKRLQKVVEANVTPTLVQLMFQDDIKVVQPALRTIGNILTGSDLQTDVVLNSGALEALDHLLTSDAQMCRKEAAWALSNIFAGNGMQIKKPLVEIADEHGNKRPQYQIVSRLLEMMQDDPYNKARKEAAWAITNLCTNGSEAEIKVLVYDYDALTGIMKYLDKDVVQSYDHTAKPMKSVEALVEIILSALSTKILPEGLRMGYGYNIFAQRLQELDGTNVLEQLALFPINPAAKVQISALAADVLSKYFPDASNEGAEYSNANEGVNAQGEMEFNPNLQAGGIQL